MSQSRDMGAFVENISAAVVSAGGDALPGLRSARQTDRKYRTRVVGEIGRTGSPAMEFGDQADDVEAEPEVRAFVWLGAVLP